MKEFLTHNIKTFYEDYFETYGVNAYRPRRAYIPFLHRVGYPDKLLDIGCGTGHLLQLAESQGIETAGVDISDNAVKLCSERLSGDIRQGRAENLPFSDDSFDGVTCIGTLEHTTDLSAAVMEVQRVATRNATVLYVVPNENFPLAGTEQEAVREVLMPVKRWAKLFRQAGFEIREIGKDPFHLKYEGWRKVGTGLVNKLLPLRWTYQAIFILEMNN